MAQWASFAVWRTWPPAHRFGPLSPVAIAVCDCDQSSLPRAEQIFAVLHNLSCPISWEVVAVGRKILFQVIVPTRAQAILDRQFAASYPDAELQPGNDALAEALAALPPSTHLFTSEYRQQKAFYLPLVPNESSRDHDPLLALLTAGSGLAQGEVATLQLLSLPAGRGWNEKGLAGASSWSGAALPESYRRLCQRKLSKPLYKASLRAASLSPLREAALLRLRGLDSALRQGNTLGLNGLEGRCPDLPDTTILRCLLARQPFSSQGLILSTEEMAQLWHLPWGNTPPDLHSIRGRQAPASAEALATREGVPLGWSTYRRQREVVILKRSDRRQHVYILGATRTGKTTALSQMVAFDMRQGRGVIVIDPHGDLSLHLLHLVPEDRIADVIYFDPADVDFPMGFNLLDGAGGRPNLLAGELMHLFRLLWGSAWGPRMNDILHNCLLTLLELPQATLADIPLLLTSTVFRQQTIAYISNLAVRDFWEGRFNRWPPSQQQESAEPILNKLNAFLADPLLYCIVAQGRSAFDIRRVMDEGKILICNLSRGRLGDENAILLGAALLSKVELAAISRADVPEERRRDVYVYVDEFQRMATLSFVSMLSELAKYHCNLTLANQYYAQIPEEVRSAIWGNVGTLIVFRVGPDDARILGRYFEPVFSAEDLMALDNYHAYVHLRVDGQTQRPFSIQTFPPQAGSADVAAFVKARSRSLYGRPKQEVEAELRSRRQGRSAAMGARVAFQDVDEE